MKKSITELLVGALLGDAHIGRTGLNKAFITFEQSAKKADYLNHLFQEIKKQGLPIRDNSLREYTRSDARYNVNNSSLYFRTESLEEIKPLAEMFLDKSGKKRVPTNIAEHLTEKSLAYWIMDDGQQVKRGGVTLCTDSFNSQEINILRDALKTNFNLITSIHKKKGSNESIYERIYINKDSLDSIKPSLIPHMHDSMLYKINVNMEFKQDTSDFVNESEVISDTDIFFFNNNNNKK